MIKKYVNKILVWGSWWLMVMLGVIAALLAFIPMTIYGLINGVGLKDIVVSYWRDGAYTEIMDQHQKIKEMGL